FPRRDHLRRAEAGGGGRPEADPGVDTGSAAVALRRDWQAARQEAGGSVPVGARGGRRSRRLRGPTQGERQARRFPPYPLGETRDRTVRQVEMGRGSPLAPP